VDAVVGVTYETIKVVGPDTLTVLITKVLVVEGNVDSAQESRVKRLDAVGGEEQNTAIVLEGTQEDRDKPVAGDVLGATTLEVDVGFVEEDEGSIALAKFEEVAEISLYVVRIHAQVTTREGDQRAVGQLSDTLCSASLSNTRSAMKQEDAALALVLDKVVAPRGNLTGAKVSGELADEGLDSHLDFVVENEVLEGFLVCRQRPEVGDV
jgi:hypothetical protein